MNQRWFFWNNFFSKKICLFGISGNVQPAQFCAEYRVWAKPNKCFWIWIWKNRIQKLRGGTGLPCLRRLQMRNFLCRKITARFKLNLKTDGLDCKMIFKFGSRIERLHSARKQCRRIYICLFCVAKYLLGTPKPLNCIPWMQAVLSK